MSERGGECQVSTQRGSLLALRDGHGILCREKGRLEKSKLVTISSFSTEVSVCICKYVKFFKSR